MAWHHEPVAPWQTPQWLADMRATSRPSAYSRQVENRFATSESTFIDMGWLDACVSADCRPVAAADKALKVWVGLDASVKRDSTAIVAVTWEAEAKRVRLVFHRIYQPSAADPLDFKGDD
jgi:hypothetical protein